MPELSELEQDLLDSMQEMIDVEKGLKPPAKQVVVTCINIKQLSQELKMSQQELAEALGVSLDTEKVFVRETQHSQRPSRQNPENN